MDPDDPCIARSLHVLANLHDFQGKRGTAEALYKQALEIFEGSLGGNHPMVAKQLDSLATLYQQQGK